MENEWSDIRDQTSYSPEKFTPEVYQRESQRVETPSWDYGNYGTRFKVFPQRTLSSPSSRVVVHSLPLRRAGAQGLGLLYTLTHNGG
jgi:hypothetical protein